MVSLVRDPFVSSLVSIKKRRRLLKNNRSVFESRIVFTSLCLPLPLPPPDLRRERARQQIPFNFPTASFAHLSAENSMVCDSTKDTVNRLLNFHRRCCYSSRTLLRTKRISGFRPFCLIILLSLLSSPFQSSDFPFTATIPFFPLPSSHLYPGS